MSDGKNNNLQQKDRNHTNCSRVSNCNVNLKLDNVLCVIDEDLVNFLANLGKTEINTSHINENSNDMSNTELGGSSSTTTSVTTDEPCINRGTLTNEGRITGVFCFKAVFGERVRFCSRSENT